MQPYQALYLADVLRDHRERLEETVRELADRGEPIGELEARLIADAGAARLLEVENFLRHEAHIRRRPLALRRRVDGRRALPVRVAARMRSWTKPRIGRLRHYEPRPIRLPVSYFRAAPPAPAPTISIVTPSFNQGRFIDRTIHSVLAQRYPSLEYHVQDGGSHDETLAVIARFEPSLTSWASEPDRGQADAINRGFRNVDGEIMAWLNSDDLLMPGALATVAAYFQAHPEVDVVYGHRILIDGSDGQVGAWVLPEHDDLMLTLADFVPQETLFWRRSIWEAAGGYVDVDYRYALDWELLLRFREVGASIVRLPRFLGAFRVHEEQKTSTQDVVGLLEMQRLRERVHGREVPVDEVLERLKPYFARHILAHTRQRFVDRLPLRRLTVETASARPSAVQTAAAPLASGNASNGAAPERAAVSPPQASRSSRR